MIDSLRTEHRAYLAGRMDDVRLAGPLMDKDTGNRIGGLLLMDFASFEEAERFFSAQPYARAGIIDRIIIHPFEPLVVQNLHVAETPESS